MPTIALPRNRKDRIKLADWMEVNSLIENDGSTSVIDMESELKISNDYSEDLKADVCNELISRSKKLPSVYPFIFNGTILKLKNRNNFKYQWSYIFCLLLSYIGVEVGQKEVKAWQEKEVTDLFERVSTIAAKNFLTSNFIEADSLQFGAPRCSWISHKRPFKIALKILKDKINDGEIVGCPTKNVQKDAGLDVVAWRNFPDRRLGKLLLLGQCKSGKDFKTNRYDLLRFENFFSIRTPFIRSFFLPHELDNNEWSEFCNDCHIGIIFDRSRIAFYAQNWDGIEIKKRVNFIKKRLKSYENSL